MNERTERGLLIEAINKKLNMLDMHFLKCVFIIAERLAK